LDDPQDALRDMQTRSATFSGLYISMILYLIACSRTDIPSSQYRHVYFSFQTLKKRFSHCIKPPTTPLLLGTFTDMSKGKSELLAENALLRQQLIILPRQVKRPIFRKRDRLLLVLLARLVWTWQQALFIVQPETMLRWHRELFRVFWKRKSKVHSNHPRLSLEIIALIKEMATNNRLWGAERIRGELLKLDIHVCKRTIQKYMRQARIPRSGGQNWSTFLSNHAKEVWACDFLQVTDLFFRPLFAFFVVELKSRKVVHVGVTRSPTDVWAAQQLREATPYGQTPRYLICDHDGKFGPCFAWVAATSGIKILKTPYHAPQANAICERFLGSVRRECLDQLLILHEKQLHRVLRAYVAYFNGGTTTSRDSAAGPTKGSLLCSTRSERQSNHLGFDSRRLAP
jgi:putative transposase